MKLAVDFGHTITNDTGDQDKYRLGVLTMVPGAMQALRTIKDRGHILLLNSHRANRARRIDSTLDPLVRAGITPGEENHLFHQARYRQMVDFINTQMPGIFDAIDDGLQGKVNSDWAIDNKTIQFRTWKQTMAELYKIKDF